MPASQQTVGGKQALLDAMIRTALVVGWALLVVSGIHPRQVQAQPASPEDDRWPETCSLNNRALTCRTETTAAASDRRPMADRTGTHGLESGQHASVSRDIIGFNSTIALSGSGGAAANEEAANKAVANEPWENCLYNNRSIPCRRTFLCPDAPCGRFKLEWKDGINDTYTRIRDGMARNVGFYKDPRGGEWMLRGFAGVFGLVNQSNQNTIIYGMSLRECLSTSALSDLCTP